MNNDERRPGRSRGPSEQPARTSQKRGHGQRQEGHARSPGPDAASRRHRPQQPLPPRPAQRPKPPTVDVDALLAHASAPDADLLAEAEAEIAEREQDAAQRERREEQRAEQSGRDLTDVVTLRQLLNKHGLRPNKSFGQHLLVDREALNTILAAAELQPEDSTLEVGSGTGVLTAELAQRTRRVVAVELDRNILPVLRDTTKRYRNVEIIPRDLLDVQPDEVFGDAPYKLVANLPYYITAMTLRHFLEAKNAPRLLVVMVQLEVAKRLTAAPGDMSLLGLSVQFYGQPRLVAKVPAAAFYPPPKVDSAVVRVDLYPQPSLTGDERAWFFTLAHAGFAEKRKMLHNSLARNLHIPQQRVADWLSAAGIEPTRRAETLSLDDWLRLTRTASADEDEMFNAEVTEGIEDTEQHGE